MEYKISRILKSVEYWGEGCFIAYILIILFSIAIALFLVFGIQALITAILNGVVICQ